MKKDINVSQQAKKVILFHPTGEYYFSKGLKAYRRRDLVKAQKYIERAFELEPTEPVIACQLAILYTELGEYNRSIVILHEILDELDPYMSECHYFLANNYAHVGLFKEAYKYADEYLTLEEDGEFCDDAEDLLDLIMLETNETEESLVEQDDLIVKQEQAQRLMESGDFQNAVVALNDIIKQYPEFWPAYNNLALAHFYMGQTAEAFSILEDIQMKNHGNLHALCNELVFYYYLRNDEKVKQLIEMLSKVKPLNAEHRFKLGATFALVGEHVHAYSWLRQLHKKGFSSEDGTFHFWLSTCAYHLGYEQIAREVWKKMLSLNPEKAVRAPWEKTLDVEQGLENHEPSILGKLASEYIEERLFGLFLLHISPLRAKIEGNQLLKRGHYCTELEKAYLHFILSQQDELHVAFADEVSQILYEKFQPIHLLESGLYLLWFSIFVEALQSEKKLSNSITWAAASEFVWHKLKSEKVTQKHIAEKYGVSPATLQKYIGMANSLLQ